MKLKKILVFILCIGICLSLVGCGNQNTTNAVANNLDKNTTKLENVVDKLQDVNYKNIVIEEISPLSDDTFNTITNTNALKKTKWYSVNGNATSDFIPTKISAEKRRDAKYVSKQNDIKKVGLTEPDASPKNLVKYLGKPANQMSQTYRQNAGNNQYRPKYINNVSENFNRDSLDKYLMQIEVIYEECADCISCNAECKNEKIVLQQNISDCRTLIKKMRDGTIKLSTEDISNCNECIKNLNERINRLNSTKNNVETKEKSIKEYINNFSANKDNLQNAYTKLLDALENRLDALCECNDCLSCICNTINNSNIDMTDALKNKSDESDIRNFEQEEQQEQPFSNIDTMNDTSTKKEDYVKNDIPTQNNTQTYNQTNVVPQNQAYNNSYNNGYSNNFGYNGYANGVGYNGIYNNAYPYPPRNIDTYGFINKNIDTYAPYRQSNQNLQSENTETESVETTDAQTAPIPNPFEEPDIKGIKDKIKKPFQDNDENQEKEGPVRPRKRHREKLQKNENNFENTKQKIVANLR